MEGKWKEAKYWFEAENDRHHPIQRAQYDRALESQGPDTEAIKTEELVSRRYFQLKSGPTVIGTYLHHIGKTKTDCC